ncbi:hypothetical protein HH304_18900 [Flammeovirgaceae bacterium KN852]|uniref:Fibronectin type-III domain-containing protein n=2 Tax=Marinigracilibium pacificum TaxID=2729599 RepID=A0A848J444_9BACT|nr:hypothetical protein [Marinigracilibium pacificum]
MKRLVSLTFIWIMFIGNPFGLVAQNSNYSIALIARNESNQVRLRWAPANHIMFELGKRHGYILERFELDNQGNIKADQAIKLLSNEPIQPWPEQKWTEFANNDANAAIAFQTLYGESFNLSTPSSDMMQMLDMATDQENRHAFGLYVADQDYEVAQAMGLAFVDKSVDKGKIYVYRIKLADPGQSGITPEPAATRVDRNEFVTLPAPLDFNVEFADKTAFLSWNAEISGTFFTSYEIQKSYNGTDFFRVDSTNYVSVVNENQDSRMALYIDSLRENRKMVYYRMRGKTPFGENGKWTEVKEGFGFPVISGNVASIKSVQVINNSKARIEWTIPETLIDKAKHLNIYRSQNDEGDYKVKLNSKPIPAKDGVYVDESPQRINYYFIEAVTSEGETSISLPAVGVLEDNIPPVKPIGVKAEIDSSGVVTIAWKPNPEVDVIAYKVYQANYVSDEPSLVTPQMHYDTVFVDTVTMNTLHEDIYYWIVAVDHVYNNSDYSEPIKLQRPDVIAPSAPVISNYSADSKGVHLTFVPSSAKDVVMHRISRQVNGNEIFADTIEVENGSGSYSYLDNKVKANTRYQYVIAAIDDAGLKGETKPISIRTASNIVSEDDEFDWKRGAADRDQLKIILNWKYEGKPVDHFILYRGSDRFAMTTYQKLDGTLRKWEDSDLIINTNYTYRIQPVLKDGSMLPISKELKVKY